MIRKLLVVSTVVLLVGCASQTTQWTPTVDTYGNSRAQYLTRDLEECRGIAESASGSVGEETAAGAGIGALAGAAAGALIGAAFSRPGEGAVAGAAMGATAMGATRRSQTQAQFQEAYRYCMRGRGHNVVG